MHQRCIATASEYATPRFLKLLAKRELPWHSQSGLNAFFVVVARTNFESCERKRDLATSPCEVVLSIGQHGDVSESRSNIENKSMFARIRSPNEIVSRYYSGPEVFHCGVRLRYQASTDHIVIPKSGRFECRDEYYTALFHELSHSTGHYTRLNRNQPEVLSPYGECDFSEEEFVAELSTAFLCAASGVQMPKRNLSVDYFEGWRRAVVSDPDIVVRGSIAAQQAAAYVLTNGFISRCPVKCQCIP